MKHLTLRQSVQACSGRYFGSEADLDRLITTASSDSRVISEGTLFVAYKGARVDGHDFMADCLKKGAACCLSEREPKDETEMPCIVVESTMRGVAAIAGAYRMNFDVPVVGITGSVGKTTAKEMIWAVLSRKFNTHKNRMNFNNEVSLPLMMLQMPEDAQAAVMEMGINSFGEMSRLATMVRPNLVVFTNVGDAHLEFLHDHAGVLKAKSEVFDYMMGEGLAILNGDDETLKNYACPVKKITFGLEESNDFYATDVESLADGSMRARIHHHNQDFVAEIPAFGAHMVYAALMGAAVGWAMGMTNDEIAAGIGDYETVGNRAKLINTGKITIFSDCYNANPNSTASAIDSMTALGGRKVCLLGDMLELGENSAEHHYKIGEKAAKSGAALVIACGKLAKDLYAGAKDCGANAVYFETKAELMQQLDSLIQPGDTVLVKASHSMAFEDFVDALQK